MKIKSEISYVDSKATGEKIKFFRKKFNLSTLELATKLGLRYRIAVNKWESGENIPTVEHLVRMSKIFKCKLDDIVISNSI